MKKIVKIKKIYIFYFLENKNSLHRHLYIYIIIIFPNLKNLPSQNSKVLDQISTLVAKSLTFHFSASRKSRFDKSFFLIEEASRQLIMHIHIYIYIYIWWTLSSISFCCLQPKKKWCLGAINVWSHFPMDGHTFCILLLHFIESPLQNLKYIQTLVFHLSFYP
jgi:hypothetical protein